MDEQVAVVHAGRVELDDFYIEHWSLALDLKIALLTPALLRGS